MAEHTIKILEAPGRTRPSNERDDLYLRRVNSLLEAAVEAEIVFGVDECEEYAMRMRRKGREEY